MAHTNSTQNYNLPQWIGSDKPTFLGDFNNAFSEIDSQLKVNSDSNLENADDISAVNTLATTNRDNLAALANRVTDAEGDITEANANIQANATSIGSITETLASMNTLIQGKQNLITGAGSTITTTNLTANKVLISDSEGKVSNASISATELGYLSGVTGNVQTQISNKSPHAWDCVLEDANMPGGGAIVGLKANKSFAGKTEIMIVLEDEEDIFAGGRNIPIDILKTGKRIRLRQEAWTSASGWLNAQFDVQYIDDTHVHLWAESGIYGHIWIYAR